MITEFEMNSPTHNHTYVNGLGYEVANDIEPKSSYVAIFGIAANRHLKKTLRLFEVPISISNVRK